jgi:hypothetical protein
MSGIIFGLGLVATSTFKIGGRQFCYICAGCN